MFNDTEIVILLTDDMLPVPDGIIKRFDWGLITLSEENISGTHVLLSGDKDKMISWLSSFKKGVWVNKEGNPPNRKKFELKRF